MVQSSSLWKNTVWEAWDGFWHGRNKEVVVLQKRGKGRPKPGADANSCLDLCFVKQHLLPVTEKKQANKTYKSASWEELCIVNINWGKKIVLVVELDAAANCLFCSDKLSVDKYKRRRVTLILKGQREIMYVNFLNSIFCF